jgi:hypothetical protein
VNQHFLKSMTTLADDVRARQMEQIKLRIEQIKARNGGVLDINQLDENDPVNLRESRPLGDVDYDADGGRGWIEDGDKSL